MSHGLACYLVIILFPLCALVESSHLDPFGLPDRAAAEDTVYDASEKLAHWLNETFIEPRNEAIPPICDYPQMSWAHNAIHFKNKFPRFQVLNSSEACAEKTETNFFLGMRKKIKLLSERNSSFLHDEGFVGLPFRQYWARASSDLHCYVSSTALIGNGSLIYSITGPSERELQEIWNRTAKQYFMNTTDVFGYKRSYSLFMSMKDAYKVPGFKATVDESSEKLSRQENSLQELTPSNTAILILPVLLALVPAHAISPEIPTFPMVLFAMATDLLASVPLLIKGGEMLHIASLETSASNGRTLLLRSAELRLAETWITQCSKTLFSRRIGAIFVFLALWAMIVGFATEYLAWKYTQEQSERNSQAEIAAEHSTALTTGPLLQTAQDSAICTGVGPASDPTDVNQDATRKPWEFMFFFAGVILSFLIPIPFFSLLFSCHPFFKKPKRREWFFKVGVMFGSINTAYIWIELLIKLVLNELLQVGDFHFNFLHVGFVLALNLAFLIALPKRKKTSRPCLERNCDAEEQDTGNEEPSPSGAMKFYVAGFVLGLFVSLFSIFYIYCFPGIQGNQRRTRLFKIGCMVGAYSSIILLHHLLRVEFFVDIGYYILIFSFAFVLVFWLVESDVFTERAELENRRKCPKWTAVRNLSA